MGNKENQFSKYFIKKLCHKKMQYEFSQSLPYLVLVSIQQGTLRRDDLYIGTLEPISTFRRLIARPGGRSWWFASKHLCHRWWRALSKYGPNLPNTLRSLWLLHEWDRSRGGSWSFRVHLLSSACWSTPNAWSANPPNTRPLRRSACGIHRRGQKTRGFPSGRRTCCEKILIQMYL